MPRRQEKPHPHYCGFDPAAKFAFVPDLGMDGVVIYKVNADSSGLEKHGFAAGPPGGGPRHMKFHGAYAFVLNELSLAVSSYKYDGMGGMTLLSTTPALSEPAESSA